MLTKSQIELIINRNMEGRLGRAIHRVLHRGSVSEKIITVRDWNGIPSKPSNPLPEYTPFALPRIDSPYEMLSKQERTDLDRNLREIQAASRSADTSIPLP